MLIGCHGPKQSGKDTFFQRASKLYQPDPAQPGVGGIVVEQISYAKKLYASAAAALGVTVEELYAWKVDPAISIQVVERRLDDVDLPYDVCLKRLSVREFLQNYGTEAHRKIFGDDFWVYHAMPDLQHKGKLCIVTDVRFENEARRVRELGGHVVQIIGPPDVMVSGDTHESEVPLPENLIDIYVDNSERSGDFNRLDVQITNIVSTIQSREQMFGVVGV